MSRLLLVGAFLLALCSRLAVADIVVQDPALLKCGPSNGFLSHCAYMNVAYVDPAAKDNKDETIKCSNVENGVGKYVCEVEDAQSLRVECTASEYLTVTFGASSSKVTSHCGAIQWYWVDQGNAQTEETKTPAASIVVTCSSEE